MATKMIDKKYYFMDDGCKEVCEFVCDTVADVAKLQTDHPNCCTGSTALVIQTGDVYMVNTSGTWVKFGG